MHLWFLFIFPMGYPRMKNSIDCEGSPASGSCAWGWVSGATKGHFLQVSTYSGRQLWAFYCPWVNCSFWTFGDRFKASSPARGTSTLTAHQQKWDHCWWKEGNNGISRGTTLKQNNLLFYDYIWNPNIIAFDFKIMEVSENKLNNGQIPKSTWASVC